MKTHQASKLISEIIGMTLWEITIGPSGINIQLGKELDSHFMSIPLKEGEISLWVQCNTKIYSESVGGETILLSLFPQEEEETEAYKKYFEGKVVLDAFIREKDQSLHILVEPNIIFSAYPWTKESEKCWTIFERRSEKTKSIIVYSDDIVIES